MLVNLPLKIEFYYQIIPACPADCSIAAIDITLGHGPHATNCLIFGLIWTQGSGYLLNFPAILIQPKLRWQFKNTSLCATCVMYWSKIYIYTHKVRHYTNIIHICMLDCCHLCFILWKQTSLSKSIKWKFSFCFPSENFDEMCTICVKSTTWLYNW